jgi:hypothetical protein
LAACGNDTSGSGDSGDSGARRVVVDCLVSAGLTDAHEIAEISFYTTAAARGNVDNPTVMGGTDFSIEVLQPAGSVPEKGDADYQLYVVRASTSIDEPVSDVLEGGNDGTVLYWRSPSAAQVRAARKCLDV